MTRYDIENELAESISEVFAEDFPELGTDIPVEEFWEEHEEKLNKAVYAVLLSAIMFGMEDFVSEAETPGVDFDSVVGVAQQWAREYGYDLVSGIVNRTRAHVRDAFSGFFNGTYDEEELLKKLSYWFGPYRAELIAITEVTRAIEQGRSYIISRILMKHPELAVDEYWVTEKDEKVCPLCSPLDGTKRGLAWTTPPPLHPVCRCTRRIEFRRR